MTERDKENRHVVITASLTNGLARVEYGMPAAVALVDEVLKLNHIHWETTLYVGQTEFYRTKAGPLPNHQLRISVRPSAGVAALNYMDHDDPRQPISNSSNTRYHVFDVDLIFNGSTGLVFPRTAVLPIPDVRRALIEWLHTWQRPRCVDWQPFDSY